MVDSPLCERVAVRGVGRPFYSVNSHERISTLDALVWCTLIALLIFLVLIEKRPPPIDTHVYISNVFYRIQSNYFNYE